MACPNSADAEQSAEVMAWAEAVRYVGLQVLHLFARRYLVTAGGLDPLDELAVAQSLRQLKQLVRRGAAEVKGAPNDAAH